MNTYMQPEHESPIQGFGAKDIRQYKDILCDFPENLQQILFEEFKQSSKEIEDVRQELKDVKAELAALQEKYEDSECDKKLMIYSLKCNLEAKQKMILSMNDICMMSQTNAMHAQALLEKIMQSSMYALHNCMNTPGSSHKKTTPIKLVRQSCEQFTTPPIIDDRMNEDTQYSLWKNTCNDACIDFPDTDISNIESNPFNPHDVNISESIFRIYDEEVDFPFYDNYDIIGEFDKVV